MVHSQLFFNTRTKEEKTPPLKGCKKRASQIFLHTLRILLSETYMNENISSKKLYTSTSTLSGKSHRLIWHNYQNGGHLGFQPPQHLAQGGKSRKVDFYDCKVSVSDVWKNQLSAFFFQVTVVYSLLLLGYRLIHNWRQ